MGRIEAIFTLSRKAIFLRKQHMHTVIREIVYVKKAHGYHRVVTWVSSGIRFSQRQLHFGV